MKLTLKKFITVFLLCTSTSFAEPSANPNFLNEKSFRDANYKAIANQDVAVIKDIVLTYLPTWQTSARILKSQVLSSIVLALVPDAMVVPVDSSRRSKQLDHHRAGNFSSPIQGEEIPSIA